MEDFCEKYSVHRTHIYTMINQKSLPEGVIIKGSRRETYVDEGYFLKRNRFVHKVQLFNQDIYYWLSTLFSDMAICRAVNVVTGCHIHSTNNYLRSALFNVKGDNVTLCRLTNSEWLFNKFGRECLRGAKRVNKKFDLTKHLDRIIDEN